MANKDAYEQFLEMSETSRTEIEWAALKSEICDVLDRLGEETTLELSQKEGSRAWNRMFQSTVFDSIPSKQKIYVLAWLVQKLAAKCVLEDIDRLIRRNARLYEQSPGVIINITKDICKRNIRAAEDLSDLNQRIGEEAAQEPVEEVNDFPTDWLEDVWKLEDNQKD